MTIQYQGVWSLQSAAQLQSTQRWVTDPLFENTTLLLQANDAANGAQNNTFLDSSSNAFAITRNGNTTQGSFTPFSLQPGAWSAYLTSVYGSSTFTSRTLFNGNSTIELWVYPNALSGQQTFVRGGGLNFGTNGAKLRIDDGVNAGSVFESTGTIVPNLWNHVAVVRTSNTFAFYINGNLDSSNASISSFYTSNATDLNTGAFNSGGSNAFAGYLSNIRVSNVARTISVPSIPYSSDANTVWLIFQTNRFVDNSSNAYALTFVGTPSIQAFSPFAPQFQWTPSVIGGSGFFDGSGDYLSLTGTNLNLGTGAFTVEGWIYQTVRAYAAIINTWTSNAGAGFSLSVDNTGLPEFYMGNATSPSVYTLVRGTVAIPLNTWVHLAGTKVAGSGGTMTLYVNGVSVGTPTASSRSLDQTSAVLGRYYTNAAGNELTGYISSTRVSNTVRTITVPTAPYTSDANTLFLANFTNAGIVDGTMKNNLETVGNAQVSTSIVKYGSGSMYFDGTGDYLFIPASLTNRLLGDFTVEFWIYPLTLPGPSAQNGVMGINTAGNNGMGILLENPGRVSFFVNGNTPITQSPLNSISATTWTHVALVRAGTTNTLYINGTLAVTSTTVSGFSTTPAIHVGRVYGDNTSTVLNGYLDDFRITNGIARYTQNFIPPSVALPRQ